MVSRGLEGRLYFHALSGRSFFYVPVLVLHLTERLSAAGIEQANAATLSLLALFAVGLAIAEYPSGVFADWAGRGRSLIVGSIVYAMAVLLLWIPGPIALLAVAQLGLGLASGFRSGADSALLYSHLDRRGETARYPGALTRLRLANLAGLTFASAAGGALYAWQPASVFVLSSVAIAIGILPLIGIDEARDGPARDSLREARSPYLRLMRDGLRELRRNRALQTLVLLGGTGGTYFIFAYWAIQSYLVGAGTSATVLGQLVALVAVLQSATITLSAWIAGRADRQAPVFGLLFAVLVGAFGAVASAALLGAPALGGAALVGAASCAPLFANLVNIRLQPVVPDVIRASVLSLGTWIGAMYYVVFFPVAGWLIDAQGVATGYGWIAITVAATGLPLLVRARRNQL